MWVNPEQRPLWVFAWVTNQLPIGSPTGKVLGNLQLNLLSKSKVYEDAALRAIFLHNNYNYILKSLEKYAFFFFFFKITEVLCL